MPNTIAVIGNGFDLSLGLPTGYRDFLESSHFPRNDDAHALCETLAKKSRLQNWIDVEAELAGYASAHSNKPDLRVEFDELRNALMSYIASIEGSRTRASAPALDFIRTITNSDDPLVFNFNYTSTVRRLLLEFGIPEDQLSHRLRSVHGTCQEKNIIFGIDDQASIPDEHVYLFKSSSQAFSGRGFTKTLQAANAIHFFGHSLGNPDHMYFRRFFGHVASVESQQTITFHYYGEEGRLDLHRQLRALTGNRVADLRSNADVHLVDVS
jgi:Bacteriophage abortive infection AbiH